jgi:hypothetical protein
MADYDEARVKLTPALLGKPSEPNFYRKARTTN